MGDPLSISAGIVGIVVSELHGTWLLLNDLDKITNAPEAVARLREVNAISASLSLLKDIEDPIWASLGTAIADNSKAALNGCETACDTIWGDLQRWTKSSKGGTLSWLDRVNVGFFRDYQLKIYSGRFHTYRLTFNSIVGIATLCSSIRNSQLTDELRKSVASQQSSIAAASSSTQKEVAVVQRTLEEVESLQMRDVPVDEDDDLETTVVSLKDLLEELTLSQTLLQGLLSKTETAEIAKAAKGSGTTKITFGTNHKGMRMGINYGSATWNIK